ncbi:hypothetical protein F751_2693 [Auxenochlorella protothecoides]|uniref:Uncharacterized protein n=1 Tax=Auxenochlorella protothecoides TaxID=3075 RepID=A0A087SL71_AUXPR|nr:hypothetical protein F751_2693 [Auxenochlorella protothecoides]KFM26475.1 hypothetical protein F751_2693 [Auxenochlorella protothecoides]
MVGFVQRFFCLAGDAGSPQRSPQSLRNAYADSARSKILAAVEQDLTDAFSRIPHPVAPAREQSLAYTRLSAQDLSPSFLFLARDLLGKIGALARTCQICQQDQVELLETLQALELAHRRSEFARARAEALATARGEALMHAQAATRDAEAQQLQLSALLQTTLEHLGCAPSPTPTRPGARASLGESRAGALRASLEGSLASLARGLHPDGAEAPTEEEEAPALDASRSHFSGFTVHTNDLAPGAPSSRGTRAEPFSLDNGSPSPRARAPGENAPPQAEAPRSSQGWRGIASALRSSVQGGAGGHRSIDPGQGLQDTPLAPAWTPVGPAGGEGRGTHSQAAAAAQRPAPLLLPGDVPAPVGAGSLRGKATTSLVRTGASLASPGFAKAGAMRACDAPAPGPQEGAQDSHPLPLGTFLSPTLEGMARWKGARPGVNPRDHIAAVFRNTEDLDFYHPFSAGMHGEPRPSSHRQYRSVSSSNAQALPHATENAPGGREEKEARPGLQGGGVPLQGRNM